VSQASGGVLGAALEARPHLSSQGQLGSETFSKVFFAVLTLTNFEPAYSDHTLPRDGGRDAGTGM